MSASIVIENKLKRLKSLNQNGKRSGCGFSNCPYGDVEPPMQRAGLSHPSIGNSVERGNPVSSPENIQAGETARHADEGAGVRCRKKRMPSCNEADTD